jgi:hypothetical protein
MPKFNWKIARPEYGPQFNVEANTRVDAIASAEAKFLSDTAWEGELVGQVNDDGTVFTRSAIPTFTATKIGRVGARAHTP